MSFEETDDHCFGLCKFAGDCLLYAGSENWEGMSCRWCKVFQIYKEVKGTEDFLPFMNLFAETNPVSMLGKGDN